MKTLLIKINHQKNGHALEFWQLDLDALNFPKIEKFSAIGGLFFAENKVWHVYIDGKFHKIYRGKKKDLTTKNGILVSVEENHDVFPWLIYNKLSHYAFVSPALTENDFKNWHAGFFDIFYPEKIYNIPHITILYSNITCFINNVNLNNIITILVFK